jgi:CelD/BcsL family acetyltransferase involved in cellulose biosynthesis
MGKISFPSREINMNFKIQILKSPEEFQQIRHEWNLLTDRCVYPNAFLRAEWLLLWWQWFGCQLGTFHVLLVWDQDRLVGGLPLFRKRNGTLQLLGCDGLTCPEYLGLVTEPDLAESIAHELVQFFVRQKDWTQLCLEDYALEDTGTARFAEMLRQQFPHWQCDGEGRYYIPLPDSYNDYLMTRSQANRYKKRKELKKATEEFHARLVEPVLSEIDVWFPELRRLGIAALAHKTTPPLQYDHFASFLHDLIIELLPRQEFRIFLLYYGDTPAAFKLGLVHNSKFYDYLTGFDPNLPGRAGNIVIHFILAKLIEEKFQEFDFLRGLEDYKTHWTDLRHPTKTIILFRQHAFQYYRRQLIELILRPLWRSFKRTFLWLRGYFFV